VKRLVDRRVDRVRPWEGHGPPDARDHFAIKLAFPRPRTMRANHIPPNQDFHRKQMGTIPVKEIP
jgi:hypothetical protein